MEKTEYTPAAGAVMATLVSAPPRFNTHSKPPLAVQRKKAPSVGATVVVAVPNPISASAFVCGRLLGRTRPWKYSAPSIHVRNFCCDRRMLYVFTVVMADALSVAAPPETVTVCVRIDCAHLLCAATLAPTKRSANSGTSRAMSTRSSANDSYSPYLSWSCKPPSRMYALTVPLTVTSARATDDTIIRARHARRSPSLRATFEDLPNARPTEGVFRPSAARAARKARSLRGGALEDGRT